MEPRVEHASATAHTRRRYDAVAPLYDLLEWPFERTLFRLWRRSLWGEVQGPDVLELGVGTGKNIPFYPDDVQLTAIDLSEAMLARARRQARRHPEKHAKLHVMDAQALDFSNDTFDETVATFVFCSVPDPVQGLREALRVTKPGGRLLLLEHMRASPPVLARLMDALDAPIHWLVGVHIARRTVENVRRAGWQIETVRSLSGADIFRQIVARKPQ